MNTQQPRIPNDRSSARLARRGGFTIVEMLVTVGVIVILVSIVVVALSLASRGAQRSRTQFLMTSISQGIQRFKDDHGYIPPVLGRDPNSGLPPAQRTLRDGYGPPDPTAGNFIQQLQQWRSRTSLAEFLLGYGDRTQDGYGRVGAGVGDSPGDRETPTLGFRSPGPDGVWGAWTNPRPNFPATGSLASRNPGGLQNPVFGVNANNDVIPGQVYGPYINLSDERLVASIDPANDQIFLPGEGGFNPDHPRTIVDYWGEPILFFRNLHQPRNPAVRDPRSSLIDVFLLRPWTMRPGEDIDGVADVDGDTGASRAMRAASFVLFSSGPDRSFDDTRRVDPDEFNRDNIVEIGQ